MTSLAIPENKFSFLYGSLFIFLLVDIARIQDVTPIGAIRPGLLALILIAFACFLNFKSLEFNHSLKVILLFSILLWLHVPFARNNRYAFNTALSFSSIFVACACINVYITDKLAVIKLFKLFYLISVYLASYALLHSGRGPGGFLHDENDIALFINLMIPLGIYLWTTANGSPRKLYLLSVLVLLAAEVSTRSRGGIVGLVCMCVLMVLHSKRKVLFSIGLITAFLCMALLIDSLVPTASVRKANYLDTVTSISNVQDSTAQERLNSWDAAWEMFKDNPLGVGGNNFQVRFQEFQSDKFKKGMWGRVAHSVWFTCLSELGIPGVILLFLLFKTSYKVFRRIETSATAFADLTKPLKYSLVAFISSGSFISVLYYPFLWYLVAIISGLDKLANEDLKSNS